MKLKYCLYFFLLFPISSQASSPIKIPHTFSITHDVGLGNGVFLVGSHSTLGGSDPLKSIPLRLLSNNLWEITVALPVEIDITWKLIKRTNSASTWANPTNAEDLTPPALLKISAPSPSPYEAKTILYHSTFTKAFILYLQDGTWQEAEMKNSGEGRTASESLFRIQKIGRSAEPLQFLFHNGEGVYDKSPHSGYGSNDYYTSLDAFFVQDGNIYNYRPPASPSPSRIISTTVNSTATGIPSRTIRIYLPRGYDENSWKKYPVLYMHDGQNVFQPGGAYGSWDAEVVANKEISQGRMRECIIVGVDNGNDYGSDRLLEYEPPEDIMPRLSLNGTADKYADFLIHNVRPTLDFNYRTLRDPSNTLTMGSSMGGIVSTYLGYKTNIFGKIGIVSPAYWASPVFREWLLSQPKPSHLKSAYIDWGSNEGSSPDEYWTPIIEVYYSFLANSFVLEDSLRLRIGINHGHNEASWNLRLPEAFRFLLSLWEEPNHLAIEEFPPRIKVASLDISVGQATIETSSLLGATTTLQQTNNLLSLWSSLSTLPSGTLPWNTHSLNQPFTPNAPQLFWRLKTQSQ